MPEEIRLSTNNTPKWGCNLLGQAMRLIGLDIVNGFRYQHGSETWAWEVDALIVEITNRVWSNEEELRKDYPLADTDPPNVIFQIADGRVFVECLVLFQTGIVLLKKLVIRTAHQALKVYQHAGDTA